MSKYSVYCDFDAEKHKQTFIDYLEVMIDEAGNVYYAVPSHQEWAIAAACKKLGVTRSELADMTPEEYYFDWLRWLLSKCGCIAVWNEYYVGVANKKQMAKLKSLKLCGLYKGSLIGR